MRHQRKHPTQLEIVAYAAIVILIVCEALLYVGQQILVRCGALCGVMFAEPLVRMFAK